MDLRRWLMVGFALSSIHTLVAQKISGTVLDAGSGELLPYVHIGIKNTARGTISRDDGSFQLDMTGLQQEQPVYFSMLGYEEYSIPIAKLRDKKVQIRLEPSSISLSEVTVSHVPKRFKKIKIGNFGNSKTTTGKSGNEPFGWGGEWGTELPKQNHGYKVKDVNFHLRYNTVDSILFRINLYQMSKDGNPTNTRLQKPAYVTSKAKQHWISLDLTDRGIWVDEALLVTMEWVRIWYAETGKNLIFFSHAKENKNRVYHRNNSYGNWMVNEKPPLALFINAIVDKKGKL